jgi:hypothetical protein
MTAGQYSFVERTEPLRIISKLRKGNWELAAKKKIQFNWIFTKLPNSTKKQKDRDHTFHH